MTPGSGPSKLARALYSYMPVILGRTLPRRVGTIRGIEGAVDAEKEVKKSKVDQGIQDIVQTKKEDLKQGYQHRGVRSTDYLTKLKGVRYYSTTKEPDKSGMEDQSDIEVLIEDIGKSVDGLVKDMAKKEGADIHPPVTLAQQAIETKRFLMRELSSTCKNILGFYNACKHSHHGEGLSARSEDISQLPSSKTTKRSFVNKIIKQYNSPQYSDARKLLTNLDIRKLDQIKKFEKEIFAKSLLYSLKNEKNPASVLLKKCAVNVDLNSVDKLSNEKKEELIAILRMYENGNDSGKFASSLDEFLKKNEISHDRVQPARDHHTRKTWEEFESLSNPDNFERSDVLFYLELTLLAALLVEILLNHFYGDELEKTKDVLKQADALATSAQSRFDWNTSMIDEAQNGYQYIEKTIFDLVPIGKTFKGRQEILTNKTDELKNEIDTLNRLHAQLSELLKPTSIESINFQPLQLINMCNVAHNKKDELEHLVSSIENQKHKIDNLAANIQTITTQQIIEDYETKVENDCANLKTIIALHKTIQGDVSYLEQLPDFMKSRLPESIKPAIEQRREKASQLLDEAYRSIGIYDRNPQNMPTPPAKPRILPLILAEMQKI